VPLAIVNLLVGTALFVSGAESLFGLYDPVVGFRGHTTFISTNHGAAFYGFGALVAGATALAWRRTKARVAVGFGAAAVALAVSAAALDSDGVLLALAASGIAALLVQWLRSGLRLPDRDVMIGLGLLAVLCAIAAIWLDIPQVVLGLLDSIASSDEHGERWAVTSAGLAAVGDFWRFGAGAGAVETVLPAYVNWTKVVPASIPVVENDVLEVLIAFGIPAGVGLIILCITPLAANARAGIDGHRNPRYAVLLVVALYVGIIAQLHFPMFALGVGAPMVVWLELLWSRRSGSKTSMAHLRVSAARALVILGLGATTAIAGAVAHYAIFVGEDPRALVRLQPASHVPYVKLGSEAARLGKMDRAIKLAEHAVGRENSPRVKLYRAQILAQADAERGAEAFDQLFDAEVVRGIVLYRFILSVEDATHRARACAKHPSIWTDVARRIARQDGPDAASEFVVSLATELPGDPRVYRLASTIYLELGQPVLAQLWAELVADAEADSGDPAPTAPLLLARSLRAAGRVKDARKVLADATSNAQLAPSAHRLGLELRGKPDSARREEIRRHHEAICKRVETTDRELCWTSEAWLSEVDGELDASQQLLRRVWRVLNDPHHLAAFLGRHGRCESLRDLESRVSTPADRKRIAALAAKCAP
jgi:hypothetical protein